MDVECPYCSEPVDVVSLERHVRAREGGGHGPQGSVPVDGVDNPWNLRVDVAESADGDSGEEAVPSVETVRDGVRRGRCPGCERGVLGLKGGDGLFSSGRRRLACPNCGWESPDWVEVTE